VGLQVTVKGVLVEPVHLAHRRQLYIAHCFAPERAGKDTA
jgi:hypothetical protein